MTTLLNKIKNTPNFAAKLIIGLLLVANLAAFSIGNTHFKLQQNTEFTESSKKEFTVLKTGWQLMHWSYSLVKFYKGTPAE
jgi:hypothetical protein